MQTQINPIIIFVAIVTITVQSLPAQNQFNINDLHPSQVEPKKSNSNFSSQRPQQLPPMQSDGGRKQLPPPNALITDNQLRGNQKPNSSAKTEQPTSNLKWGNDLSSQPKPPAPGSSLPSTQAPRLPAKTASAAGAQGQNPLEALNPGRLPQGQQPSSANRDLHHNPYAASSIPSSPPSTHRSILNPISQQSDSDSQIIVAAGFENEDSTNKTETRAPRSKNTIKNIISQFSIAQTSQPLPGVPVTLEEMLRTTQTQSRLSMVQQYWETYFDWATLQNRQQYEKWLNSLPGNRPATDGLLLQTAKSMAKNESLAAEIQLSRSQSVLQEISRANPEEMLPLPLNDPVTSRYITHYDWYATRQMVPAKLKGINEMLPRTYQLLGQRAETVGQAQQARNQTLAAYNAGRAGMAAVLESGRAWQSATQSLIATVVSYNKAISDYALTITPPQKSIADIASMLVSKSKPISANELTPANPRSAAADSRNSYRERQLTTSPKAIGPNAGAFRRSTLSAQPATSMPSGRIPNPNSPAQFGSDRSSSPGSNPATNTVPNRFAGPPPSRQFAPPQSPGSGSFQSREAGASAAHRNGTPTNPPQDDSNQLFGSGSGGAFGGG